jgi:hypothetical protein
LVAAQPQHPQPGCGETLRAAHLACPACHRCRPRHTRLPKSAHPGWIYDFRISFYPHFFLKLP